MTNAAGGALYLLLVWGLLEIPFCHLHSKGHIISSQFSYPILSYPILSDPIPSYHIISYHIISYHIISYHIISYHIISLSYHCHIIVISYHIISYHIISYHIISYHIISYHIISYHITSYHISYHIMSCHIILTYCDLTYPYIICLNQKATRTAPPSASVYAAGSTARRDVAKADEPPGYGAPAMPSERSYTKKKSEKDIFQMNHFCIGHLSLCKKNTQIPRLERPVPEVCIDIFVDLRLAWRKKNTLPYSILEKKEH